MRSITYTCVVGRGVPFSWFWSTNFQNSKNLMKFTRNGVDSYKKLRFWLNSSSRNKFLKNMKNIRFLRVADYWVGYLVTAQHCLRHNLMSKYEKTFQSVSFFITFFSDFGLPVVPNNEWILLRSFPSSPLAEPLNTCWVG